MTDPKVFVIGENREPVPVEKIRKSHLTCPHCSIELEVTNFLVKAFLSGFFQYDCPECGHSWKPVEKVGGKKPPQERNLKHRPFERLSTWKSERS